MNAQFQLGLELTNVLNPLTSAVSALGSLALVKAIKRAGSDALTELELASFLGRNRIDPRIQLHFREIVGRMKQTELSRYLDIVLDSGAGPTVQNALQNPELLSMVIQLSALCYTHESDSLAQAIVEAIGRNVRELRGDLTKVPDYPSLCGTLRVCKQETASFQWSHLYDAVEHRIESSIKGSRSSKRRKSSTRSQESVRPVGLNRPSIAIRTLPFPVLQVLLLCLHSLQQFPDERLLNIECTSGISTLIVWCYYVLGLNVKLILQGHEIDFGEPSRNVFIRESTSRESHASLLHPNSQHEPLFTLTSREGDPRVGPELRKKARGFGHEVVKQLGVGGKDLNMYYDWVIHQSLRVFQARAELNGQSTSRKSDSNERHCFAKWSNAEVYDFTEDRIIRAGAFLFDLERVDERSVKADAVCSTPAKKHLLDLSSLAMLLLSLARVEPEDLQNCSDLPLSTQVQQRLKEDEPCAKSIACGNLQTVALGLTKSFDILSRFLQGPIFSEELNKRTVLVSACGWSLYFDSVNGADPADVSVSTLRFVHGVPTHHGVRKTRIIDGPTELLFSPSESLLLKNQWKTCVDFFPGVSMASRGPALVGHHEHDAFQVTQTFEWQYQGSISRKHILGFREMLELCIMFSRLLPCHCERDSLSLQDVAEIYVGHKDLVNKPLGQGSEILRNFYCFEGQKVHTFSDHDVSAKPPERRQPLNECVFSAQNGPKSRPASEAWFFYVSNNPAARWMEMCDMYPHMVGAYDRKSELLLRGPETCFQCAFEAIIPKHNQPSTHGSQDEENPVAFVLL